MQKRNVKKWESGEILFLKENYLVKEDYELAQYLNRSKRAVSDKRKRLKLFIPPNIHFKRIAIHHPDQQGDLNHNWKGGISKNNYHYKKLQIARYPERVNARRLVHYALKSGKLKKENCKTCGCKNVQAHHKDYAKPLDVIWLCKTCHNKLHNKNKK